MLLFGVAYYKGQIFDPWSWANSRDKNGQGGLGGRGVVVQITLKGQAARIREMGSRTVRPV